jgi:hypothetical protein
MYGAITYDAYEMNLEECRGSLIGYKRASPR